MLQKPYGIVFPFAENKTIDANSPSEVRWKVSGSIPNAFSIVILDNTDNSPAWSLPKTSSYAMKYTIPSGVLQNGKEYKIRIIVWNEANETTMSDFVVFETSSRPIISLPPLDTIGSPSFVFNATYQQGENVPLKSWNAFLYDDNQNKIAESGIMTVTPIEYVVNNLNSETNYFIEFKVTSNKGLTSTTGLIPFYVLYTRPQINVSLIAENVPEVAGIKLQWKPIQIIFDSNDTPLFIDDEKIDLRDGNRVITASEGFNIRNDFTLKLWIEDPHKVSKGVLGETFIIASASPPSDLSAIWVHDPSQIEEKIIGVIASNSIPSNPDSMWIDDQNITSEKTLTPYVGEDKPSNSHLWFDVDSPAYDSREPYLLKLFGENGNFKLWYENNRFYVIKDIDGIISIFATNEVIGTKFLVVFKQIGSGVDLFAQRLD